jgi:hypothetical protein
MQRFITLNDGEDETTVPPHPQHAKHTKLEFTQIKPSSRKVGTGQLIAGNKRGNGFENGCILRMPTKILPNSKLHDDKFVDPPENS